jgi:predicted HTH domain antitoxin
MDPARPRTPFLRSPYDDSGMTLSIPDDILKAAGLSERDALVEFACRLFDAGKLPKSLAARLCGLDRPSFEAELHRRGLTVYRTTVEDYEQDLESFSMHARKAG